MLPRGNRLRGVPGLVLLLVGLVWAAGASAQPQPAGRIIAVQGRVEIERAAVVQVASVRQELLPGDVVRTGPASRAALLLADESRIKLNANSTLRLRAVPPRPPRGVIPVALRAARTLLELVVGEVWVQAFPPPDGFEIETPAITATIRGTEFNLAVAADGESRLALLEGLVDYRNPFGAVLLQGGELGLARVGQPPQKQILLNPEDAVQWSLYYPGIVSFRDYPLVTADRVRLEALLPQARAEAAAAPGDPDRQARVGEILHDLGRPREARTAFEAALSLDPSHGRALAGLGWVALEEGQLPEAERRFAAISPLTQSSLLGISLVHFRRGEFNAAVAALEEASRRFPPSPLILTQRALFQLLAGQVVEASLAVDDALRLDPGFALAHGLLSTIALTQNRKGEALTSARRAVEANPHSPSAYLDLSLALQAHFDLEAALEAARRAVALDPGNARAHVQVARLLFGFDRIEEATRAAERALALEPSEPLVLTTAGFIQLARGETARAIAGFQRALQAGSTSGDPYLGLGLAAFRQGRPEEGLLLLQAAVLMEPRVSLFQSYLAKGLYQVERREEALGTLDRAAQLDPRDPTPGLYRGVFLRDLKRPADAIAAFQHSEALNDNRAVYRSRLLLDRDLATRAVNLARAYEDLGQQRRALAAGIRALHEDPQSSSAHLFYASTLLNTFGAGEPANSELLQTRMLLPVNQNTFNTFNDYTMLLEQPRLQAEVEGTVGSFETQEATVVVRGGTTQVAGSQLFSYSHTDGPKPRNADDHSWFSITFLKAAPTLRSSAFFSLVHFDDEHGSTANNQRAFTPNDRDLRVENRSTTLELGYQVQTRPENNLLLLAQGQFGRFRAVDQSEAFLEVPGFVFPTVQRRVESRIELVSREPFYDVQAAYFHRVGGHQFWFAADYYNGEPEERQKTGVVLDFFLLGAPLPPALDPICLFFFGAPCHEEQIERQTREFRREYVSFVAQDTWRVRPDLYLTGALRYDHARDVVSVLGELRLDSSVVSPQVGLLWRATPAHTLRLAAFRAFQTHSAARLFPSHLAGFFIEPSLTPSSDSRQYHAAWDADLTATTFLTLGMFRRDVDFPAVDFALDGTPKKVIVTQHRTGLEAAINQIVGRYWGVSLDYLRLHRAGPGEADGDDDLLRFGLHFVHPIGFSARAAVSYVQQDLGATRAVGAPRDFVVSSFRASYEFPNKWAVLTVGAENVARQRFDLVSDGLRRGIGRDLIRVSELPDLRLFTTLRVNF